MSDKPYRVTVKGNDEFFDTLEAAVAHQAEQEESAAIDVLDEDGNYRPLKADQ